MFIRPFAGTNTRGMSTGARAKRNLKRGGCAVGAVALGVLQVPILPVTGICLGVAAATSRINRPVYYGATLLALKSIRPGVKAAELMGKAILG